jgi:hypothetical protein
MFQPYTVPSVAGISFATGSNPPQPLQIGDARLCLLAYAVAAQQALGLGGTLVDASATPSLNMSFPGLLATSAYRPYYLILPVGSGFLGYNVAAMYGYNAVNGGGIGNPGVYQNGTWKPTAIPPAAVATPAPASGKTDATVFYQMQSAPSATAPAASGAGLTAAEDASLTHTEHMVEALLAAERITIPTA